MKFKVGDKVKFLNERGGGIISKIISPGMVSVSIEDGFDIPVMVSEIIRTEPEVHADSTGNMGRGDVRTINTPPPVDSDKPKIVQGIPLSRVPGQGEVPEGIYFAFVPHDQKWMITGLIDVYLVNHTFYFIQYSIYLETGQQDFLRLGFGSVGAESMLLVDTIEREHLGKWEYGIVQVLYHRERDQKVLIPGSSRFRIRTTKFYQEGQYRNSAIISGKAILISLLPLSAQVSLAQSETMEKEKDPVPNLVESTFSEPEHIIDKHKTGPREAVVDLHIGELVEKYDGLENAEILRIQVNYFSKCLDNAIVNHLTKVTFIHGVGTGVLKTAIKQILKDYPNLEYRDASMQQFGYGAMDVIIRR